jgi:nicotinamide riboside transporter PnuC
MKTIFEVFCIMNICSLYLWRTNAHNNVAQANQIAKNQQSRDNIRF